jgi:hypothetical protein
MSIAGLRLAAVAQAIILTFAFSARAGEDDDVSGGPSLRTYGFADFNYTKFVYDDPRWETDENIPKHGAFSVGNLNVFLDGKLDQSIRSLVEVRFTYLPNGVALQGDSSGALTTSTRVIDYAQLRATAQWGGIVLERAWVEYRLNELFTLRAGQFLTPYGQWNVDHGSPTLIDVAPPFVIGQELLPKSQVGLEAYGTRYLGDTRVGYHLTMSNGRIGDNPQFLDYDSSFGFGGRVFADLSFLGDLKLGASVYGGKSTQVVRGLSIEQIELVPGDPTTALPYYIPFSRQLSFKELSFGVDARWQLGGLLLIAEYLQQSMSSIETTSSGLAQLMGAPLDVASSPDFTKKGYYIIAGYSLPYEVMPFVMFQYINDSTGSRDATERNKAYGYTAGINWHLKPNVVVKASYTISKFPDAPAAWVNSKKFDWFSGQIAWAF